VGSRAVGTLRYILILYPEAMPDYEQCQFCERIFQVSSATHESPTLLELAPVRISPLDRHIREDHHKVRLRKGSNYKWVDAAEVKRLAESWDEMRRAAKSGAAPAQSARK
jgi:hypothetical protein